MAKDWSKHLERGEHWLTKEYRSPKRRAVVQDQNLIRREFYNPNKFSVSFVRMDNMVDYIVKSGIRAGDQYYLLKHDEFLVLPHAYFVINAMDPAVKHFDMTVNFGSVIGKLNKHPARGWR